MTRRPLSLETQQRNEVGRRIFLSSFCLASVSICTSCESNANWKEYRDESAGYAVSFPSLPRSNHFTAQSEYGPITVYVTRAKFEKLDFAVIYKAYPREALTTTSEVFDLALLDVARELSGKVSRHFEQPLGRVNGRGYVVTFGRERVARGWFVLDGERLYHLQVALPADQLESPRVERFMQSFRLNGDQNASDS